MEYDLPKTAEELADDETFISRFMPLSPILIVLAIVLATITMGGEQSDSEQFISFGRWLVMVVVSWIAIYQIVGMIQRWQPSNMLTKTIKGSVVGMIFAPFTCLITVFCCGMIDALILLFTYNAKS